MTLRALVVRAEEGQPAIASVEEGLDDSFLMPGDVTVDVDFSSINYKDGLAITGKRGIIRRPVLIPGIDLVGTVSQSEVSTFAVGDRVLINGAGLGETHHGGLASRARVSSESLIAVPSAISQRQAAAIGTAGFTAMLAVIALERAGASGEILVTGAAGGVGSIAIALLSRLGYSVAASTGRPAEHDYLRSLGATTIVDRSTLSEVGSPLQSQRWGGAIDSVGGATLANVLAQVKYGATVAACGNAQSPDVAMSVYPFILRAATLTGINSVDAPRAARLEAWNRLAVDLDLDLLDSLTNEVALADSIRVATEILAGQIRGRIVVDTNR